MDGDPLTYSWSLTAPAGSTAALSNPSIINPGFYVDRSGTYTARLIVNDGVLNSAPDTVVVSTQNSRPVASLSYRLEYGQATLEMQRGSGRLVVVDDVLATGGTASATVRLVEALGGVVVGVGVLIELEDFGGRALLEGHLVESLARY